MTFGPLDDPQAVLHLLRRMAWDGAQAHAAASEEGGLTGTIRDMLFGINSTIDALLSLVEQSVEVSA